VVGTIILTRHIAIIVLIGIQAIKVKILVMFARIIAKYQQVDQAMEVTRQVSLLFQEATVLAVAVVVGLDIQVIGGALTRNMRGIK
jgi:hypothetical protein